MSAFEPQLPAEPRVDMPDFMVVLRGFDRRQVEMWAAEVANQLEQERHRADEAEKRAYRVQIENKGAPPSFAHLGTHVASILEEAGKSSEHMLADAADRAQETVEAAGAEAAEIIKAAEHRAGEIEGEARQILEDARAEGARVEEDALQAAEAMRAQAELDARAVLEEARDATDMIWQEAERERIEVEGETIRLETLRHRSLEQLGRVYGHLESVLDEVGAGISRVEEEQEDLDEATAAAAARLGVEPPAASPEESPRFPAPRATAPVAQEEDESGPEEGMLSAARPGAPAPATSAQTGSTELEAGSATPEAASGTGPAGAQAEQPALDDERDQPSSNGTSDATQPTLGARASDTTQPVPAGEGSTEAIQPVPAAADGPPDGAADGNGQTPDLDVTQRLEPVGNKPRSPKQDKPRG